RIGRAPARSASILLDERRSRFRRGTDEVGRAAEVGDHRLAVEIVEASLERFRRADVIVEIELLIHHKNLTFLKQPVVAGSPSSRKPAEKRGHGNTRRGAERSG